MAPWVEGFLVCLCLFAGCRKSREVNSCCRVLIALISELCFVHGHGKGEEQCLFGTVRIIAACRSSFRFSSYFC